MQAIVVVLTHILDPVVVQDVKTMNISEKGHVACQIGGTNRRTICKAMLWTLQF